jgi:hypothetical protein
MALKPLSDLQTSISSPDVPSVEDATSAFNTGSAFNPPALPDPLDMGLPSTDVQSASTEEFASAFNPADAPAQFGTADDLQKQEEVLDRLDASGEADKFSSITSDPNSEAESSAQLEEIKEQNYDFGENDIPQQAREDGTTGFKVSISQEPSFGNDSIVLHVMPSISENRSATYDAFSPIQHPGEILKYRGTSSRGWSIAAKLISRNISEASENLKTINIIRSWLMPFYGTGTALAQQTKNLIGAPPPILTLRAYGSGMIGPVKCILENYSWDFPNDVDYIKTDTDVPFPTVMNLTLAFKESWAPSEYSSFNIIDYRNGNLPAAFAATLDYRGPSSGSTTPIITPSPASATAPATPSPTSEPVVIKANQPPPLPPVPSLPSVPPVPPPPSSSAEFDDGYR